MARSGCPSLPGGVWCLPRKRTERPTEPRVAGSSGMKRPTGGHKHCWQYNDRSCTYGRQCKFPHVCRGAHPKSHCPSAMGQGNGRSSTEPHDVISNHGVAWCYGMIIMIVLLCACQ